MLAPIRLAPAHSGTGEKETLKMNVVGKSRTAKQPNSHEMHILTFVHVSFRVSAGRAEPFKFTSGDGTSNDNV